MIKLFRQRRVTVPICILIEQTKSIMEYSKILGIVLPKQWEEGPINKISCKSVCYALI